MAEASDVALKLIFPPQEPALNVRVGTCGKTFTVTDFVSVKGEAPVFPVQEMIYVLDPVCAVSPVVVSPVVPFAVKPVPVQLTALLAVQVIEAVAPYAIGLVAEMVTTGEGTVQATDATLLTLEDSADTPFALTPMA